MNDKQENKLCNYLKRKYKLSDDDIEEFIDSFNIINEGENITAYSLKEFVNDKIDDLDWDTEDCKQIIIKINMKINSKMRNILDLRTYLLYMVPICTNSTITRIAVREIFDSLDENLDGKLTCTELISLLYKINKQFDPEELATYKKQIKNLCVKADATSNGYISYEEFKTFILEQGMAHGIPKKTAVSSGREYLETRSTDPIISYSDDTNRKSKDLTNLRLNLDSIIAENQVGLSVNQTRKQNRRFKHFSDKVRNKRYSLPSHLETFYEETPTANPTALTRRYKDPTNRVHRTDDVNSKPY